ncbi:hypothetical protein MRS76_15425 [Rhizobiaceae bacterium n13]|uniref:hypothetical protein n=1 Tax=Ferirhizobium litorale TaxID=2927786 RepID=UPI0024B2DAD5|nr:hypothetical protein [Fererhizobium litorale]MDI7863347.1 hypothetical protein [Fererhizobium litorale]
MALTWKQLTTYELPSKQPNDLSFHEPWRLVCESIEDATDLKIAVTGEWKVKGNDVLKCGPNGLLGFTLAESELVLKGCPFGALLGKIGGSSAFHKESTTTSAADQLFAIGAYCTLKLPEETTGPLFIGFNALARPIEILQMKIVVSSGRIV